MKKIILFLLPAAMLTGASFMSAPHTVVYKVDTSKSVLEWTGAKVTGKHNGTINLSGGVITDNHGEYGGSFEIDMTSIVNLDLEAGSKSKERLENHLKSADFFDVAVFPKAKFVITSMEPLAQPTAEFSHHVKGNLTIKDKTHEITFNALLVNEEIRITCTGTAVVDRSKFDVKYGSKSFFADIGDKMIYDEFTLKFNVVANLQQ